MSSLRRGHANLLCIVPILVYVAPKRLHQWKVHRQHKNAPRDFKASFWCVNLQRFTCVAVHRSGAVSSSSFHHKLTLRIWRENFNARDDEFVINFCGWLDVVEGDVVPLVQDGDGGDQ